MADESPTPLEIILAEAGKLNKDVSLQGFLTSARTEHNELKAERDEMRHMVVELLTAHENPLAWETRSHNAEELLERNPKAPSIVSELMDERNAAIAMQNELAKARDHLLEGCEHCKALREMRHKRDELRDMIREFVDMWNGHRDDRHYVNNFIVSWFNKARALLERIGG